MTNAGILGLPRAQRNMAGAGFPRALVAFRASSLVPAGMMAYDSLRDNVWVGNGYNAVCLDRASRRILSTVALPQPVDVSWVNPGVYSSASDRIIFTAGLGTSYGIVVINPGSLTATFSSHGTSLGDANPEGLVYVPSMDRVYVSVRNQSYVAVFSATGTLVASNTPAVGYQPQQGVYIAKTNRVWIPSYNGVNITIINPTTNTAVTTLSTSAYGYGMAAAEDYDRAYLFDRGNYTHLVFNTATNTYVGLVQQANGSLYASQQGARFGYFEQVGQTVNIFEFGAPSRVIRVNPATNRIVNQAQSTDDYGPSFDYVSTFGFSGPLNTGYFNVYVGLHIPQVNELWVWNYGNRLTILRTGAATQSGSKIK